MTKEKDYVMFILGYDLLHDYLDTRGFACDEAMDLCEEIAKRFMESDEYKDMSVGLYDALNNYMDNRQYDVQIILKGEEK